MATSVMLCDADSPAHYSIEITDDDGDKMTIEATPAGLFVPPGQNLVNGLTITPEDLKVVLQAYQEVMPSPRAEAEAHRRWASM
jgi:hypothetical protein